MKAAVLVNYGLVENLHFQTVTTPVPGDNDVLVKIEAAAVNHLDIGIASGAMKNDFPVPMPWIPGIDFAGVIDAVGKNVQDYKIGDAVYGVSMPGGAYAEYIVVSPEMIALKPKTLSFIEAASVPVAAITAWQVVVLHAKIAPGQTVLIHGGAGAVGTYAVQFAHQTGAKVIVTASPKSTDFLKSLGADEVIDYKAVPFESVVGPVDAVIDLAGGDVQQRSYALIKEGGYLVSVNQPVSDELATKFKIHAIFAQMQPSHDGLTQIADSIDSGRLTINLGNVYPLPQAGDAWNELMGKPVAGFSKTNGRVVLQVQ